MDRTHETDSQLMLGRLAAHYADSLKEYTKSLGRSETWTKAHAVAMILAMHSAQVSLWIPVASGGDPEMAEVVRRMVLRSHDMVRMVVASGAPEITVQALLDDMQERVERIRPGISEMVGKWKK